MNSIFWLLICFVIAFLVQLIFCLKVKQKALKFILLYLIVVILLYGIATYLGLFGSYSFGSISGNELSGLIIMIFDGALSFGILIAWITCLILKKINKKL